MTMSKKKKDEAEEQDTREALRNFVVNAKVSAFIDKYDPCNSLYEENAIVLNESDLRKLFGAYVKTVGDPLVIYIDEFFAPGGYKMMVNDLTGEMVMCVREKA